MPKKEKKNEPPEKKTGLNITGIRTFFSQSLSPRRRKSNPTNDGSSKSKLASNLDLSGVSSSIRNLFYFVTIS